MPVGSGPDVSSRVNGACPGDARDIELSLTDADRFGAVFDKYFAEIHGYAARRVGSDAADDIAAEVFLTAFRVRHRFDPGRGTVKAWLYGIVTNHLSAYRRQEQRAYRAMARAGVPESEEGHAGRVVDQVAAEGMRPALLVALAYLLQTVPAIMEMPVTSAVRAALYRMLADLPGTENLGQVKDPAGQQGDAVGYTASYQDCTVDAPAPGNPNGPASTSCTVQQILIIDPVTGLPMAEDLRYTTPPGGQQWTAPDGLFSYEIFGQSYWTNQNPPNPAEPPQVSMQPMILPKSTAPGKDCVTFTNMHGQVTLECPKAVPSHLKSSGAGARR